MITFTITSCGRLDLLEQTLNSFFRNHDWPIDQFVMTDDSGDEDVYHELLCKYGKKFTIIRNDPRCGQGNSLDKLFKSVRNPYIFHCEDDWLFEQNGFIERSVIVLQNRPDIHQVWVRHQSDTPHKIIGNRFNVSGVECFDMNPDFNGWNGYSWNPGLRRTIDYTVMFPNGIAAVGDEFACAQHVKKFNYKAISLKDTSCRHIGYGRHTDDYIV